MAMTCSDCGFPVKGVTPEKIAKGSSVRDPGEAVCNSCTASRSKLLQELAAIPDNLRSIKALRMVRA